MSRFLKSLVATTLVVPLVSVPAVSAAPAHAQDLSAESLSSLSSFGSSAAGVLSSVGKQRTGERIVYDSVNEQGETVRVSGALFDVDNAKGLVALAPGTRGVGKHCAPSAPKDGFSSITGSSVNVNYEAPVVRLLNKAGYRVVVTDYMGLGDRGSAKVHTYLNRIDQGHALIDAARHVSKPDEKVAFWGYSQGGGAAAAAAELVGEYAPELNVVGTFAGAPPADPLRVIEDASVDLITTVAGFGVISYSETYPEFKEAIDELLTDEGREMLKELANACVLDGPRVVTKPFSAYTKTGKTLAEAARTDDRIYNVLEHNALGRVGTSAPIMVLTNPDDDMVPEPQATQLASDYCTVGAPVEYRKVLVPGTDSMPLFTASSDASSFPAKRVPVSGHAAPLVLETKNAITWLDDRVAGKKFTQVCPGEEALVELTDELNSVEQTAVALGVLAAVAGIVGLGGWAAYNLGLIPSEWLAMVPQQWLGMIPPLPQLPQL